MLTGRVAYAGDTVSDTIAVVLKREPDWAALPPDVPAALQRLLTRCLEKDRKERLRDVGDGTHIVFDRLRENSDVVLIERHK